MLAGQRQKLILDELRRLGAVRVSELTELLGRVGHDRPPRPRRARRSGLVDKVHGGATARGLLSADEPGFEAKSHSRSPRRRRSRGLPGDSSARARWSALTAGTTTWRLAHHLLDVPDLTVVTNSIQVADVLHRPRPARPHGHPHRRRSDAVGRARRSGRGDVDPLAARRHALHGRARHGGRPGLHDAEPARGRDGPRAHRRGETCGRRRGPHEMGRAGPRLLAPLDEADVLVTDSRPPAEAQ